MTLAALIRKRGIESPATAIPAIPATQHGKASGTVARIATIAVATSPTPDGDQWQEFERLLAIVGRANQFSPEDFTLVRTVARGDLANALISFRDLADQLAGSRP